MTRTLPRGKHHRYRADGHGYKGGGIRKLWIATTRALLPTRWQAE